jgi:hypothetical protein
LYEIIENLLSGFSRKEIRNKIYCLQIAGWVSSEAYSGKDYFFVNYDIDPIIYTFKDGVVEKDSVRRKADIAVALTKLENAPKHIRGIAANRRSHT